MPYKNLGKKREYQREWVRQKRSKGSTTYPHEPIIDAVSPSVQREGYGKASSTHPSVVELDADGNIIPSCE